jgi:hypothetical protein
MLLVRIMLPLIYWPSLEIRITGTKKKARLNFLNNGKRKNHSVMPQPGSHEPKLRRRIIIYPGPYEPELQRKLMISAQVFGVVLLGFLRSF